MFAMARKPGSVDDFVESGKGGKESLSIAIMDEFYTFDVMMYVGFKVKIFFLLYSTYREDKTFPRNIF